MDSRSHDIISLGILGILERRWNFQRTKRKLVVCQFSKKGRLDSLARTAWSASLPRPENTGIRVNVSTHAAQRAFIINPNQCKFTENSFG